MNSVCLGLFAVPSTHLQELTRLSERWLIALNRFTDDFIVRENELYRFAASVARHRVELAGEEVVSAFPEVTDFIECESHNDEDLVVFSPQDVQTFARAVTELEQRLGGEDAVVRGVLERSVDESPEAVREVYRACKEALQAAAEQGHGFVWATLTEGAEARLEEKRRQREIARKEAMERPRWTPEQRAQSLAQLEGWVEERVLAQLDERDADNVDVVNALLCLVPDEHIPAIRQLQDRSNECYDAEDWDQGMELSEKADLLAQQEAEERVTLEMHGEVSAAEELHKLFAVIAPQVYQEMGAYSAAETRELSRALKSWLERHGRRALIDELVPLSYGKRPDMVTRACEAMEQALERAAERGLGFVLVIWYDT